MGEVLQSGRPVAPRGQLQRDIVWAVGITAVRSGLALVEAMTSPLSSMWTARWTRPSGQCLYGVVCPSGRYTMVNFEWPGGEPIEGPVEYTLAGADGTVIEAATINGTLRVQRVPLTGIDPASGDIVDVYVGVTDEPRSFDTFSRTPRRSLDEWFAEADSVLADGAGGCSWRDLIDGPEPPLPGPFEEDDRSYWVHLVHDGYPASGPPWTHTMP